MRILDVVGSKLGQLNEMAAHAGATFESDNPYALESDLRRAVTRCIFCRRAAECRAWLDAREGGRGPAAEFCPNRDLIEHYRTTDSKAERRAIPVA